MRLPTRDARLLLLLAPSIAAALTPNAIADAVAIDNVDPTLDDRSDPVDKVAPVDGNDGRPHNGPWVETDGKVDESLPPLEGRPEDPTVVDGEKIPESHDGVMNDPNREPPKEGTRGTEGGVSEKSSKMAEEDQKGGKTPETPKEAPVDHHEEQPAPVNNAGENAPPNEDGEASGLEVGDIPCFSYTSYHMSQKH